MASISKSDVEWMPFFQAGLIDSLTQGVYIVPTIRSIAGETHRDAYPAFGALAVVLFSLGL
ncbi:hypothetical protein A1A1_07172 [Planococcus antarcticus DSM 14505]|uniref:MFS transporter n=1 Tax=Planococcus antarcticus DSM 14505 TaxID=1185653 RepID=A0A1C7DFQ9_9BACL|nr:hypothetical protein BBH88_08030 [Planococcus antarcticus DSM 14505]EIM07159.1 hypothetical protein A1A1_07172 [Planococcus antarcticus DSM 14505]